MNKISILALLLLSFALTVSAQEKAVQLQSFIADIVTVSDEKLDVSEPIAPLAELLRSKSDTSLLLNKEGMVEGLSLLESYRFAIIVVGNHTIVKITDKNDIRQSGAWGTKVPKGVALIQRSGVLTEKNDYINNLIGVPDNQKRFLFLFK